MIRYIRLLFLAVIAVTLIVLALANRSEVTLTLLPPELGDLANFNPTVTLPVFAVIFVSIVIGLLIGFVWEWLREHKHRASANRNAREVHTLKRQLKKVNREGVEAKDEVLAILDEAS